MARRRTPQSAPGTSISAVDEGGAVRADTGREISGGVRNTCSTPRRASTRLGEGRAVVRGRGVGARISGIALAEPRSGSSRTLRWADSTPPGPGKRKTRTATSSSPASRWQVKLRGHRIASSTASKQRWNDVPASRLGGRGPRRATRASRSSRYVVPRTPLAAGPRP